MKTIDCSQVGCLLHYIFVWFTIYRVPRELGEMGKWRPGQEKTGNNDKITQNRGKKQDYPWIGKVWICFKQ